jgi:hypothetical protein
MKTVIMMAWLLIVFQIIIMTYNINDVIMREEKYSKVILLIIAINNINVYVEIIKEKRENENGDILMTICNNNNNNNG